MLKFGGRLIAPVAVEKLSPATSAGDRHVLQLDSWTRLPDLLTWLAFAAGIGWLALLFWLEARGLAQGRGKRLHLAAPFFALLVAIALLVYGCG
jgi:hypothetical protein